MVTNEPICGVSQDDWTAKTGVRNGSVPRTRFANGVVVTINPGNDAYTMAGGSKVPPHGLRTEGISAEP
jgi:hypothetical protein